jgi:hypothetical protein
VFFDRLAATGDYVGATRLSLLLGVGLFVVALLACFLLPRPGAPQATPAGRESAGNRA